MVGVEGNGVVLAVGDEGVIAVVGEERGPGVVHTGAAHDAALALVVGLADPGVAPVV